MAKCKKCGRTYSIWTSDMGSGLCRECTDTEAKPKVGDIKWWCKHCHREVSPEAQTCPHCGHPEPATDEVPAGVKNRWVAYVVLGLCGLLIYALYLMNRCL